MEKEWNKRQTQPFSISMPLDLYFSKMRGVKGIAPNIQVLDSLISAFGALIAISVISLIVVVLGFPMVLGPIGATCLLVFAAHAGAFSQPRHILGGHVLSTFTALLIWEWFGRSHLTIGITLAAVAFLMVLTKTVHPPAAASAIVAINTQAGWGFLLSVAAGALIVVLISLLYNNLFASRQYPKQWL